MDHVKFLSKVKINKDSDCWEWSGELTSYGYPKIYYKGKRFRAHRVSYNIFKGVLDSGLVIDHICRNKKCVNPEHLRQVNKQINAVENSVSIAALNKAKTHCRLGHEYTQQNTRIHKNSRHCITCDKASYVRYKLKEKGE